MSGMTFADRAVLGFAAGMGLNPGTVIDLFRDDARRALGGGEVRFGALTLAAPLLPPGFVSRAPGEIEGGGDASLLGRFRHAVCRHVFERPLDRLAYRVEPFFWRLALRIFDRAERHAERLKQASGETHEFVAR